MMLRMAASAATATLAVILAIAPLLAQQVPPAAGPGGLHLTRQELNDLLEQLQVTAESSSTSSDAREQARLSAARVRDRLAGGDFRPGDRIMLNVRMEPALSGEFIVEPGNAITLPELGAVSLAGVLRSELEGHMRQELGRFLQNPVVQAHSLIRIAVLGEVGSPGYFTLPASMVLEDVVMRAGGPTRNADLDRIRIERSGDPVWRDQALQEAMLEARTLDQLSLQAGDRVVVPRRGTPLLSFRTVWTVVTTATAFAYMLRRIF